MILGRVNGGDYHNDWQTSKWRNFHKWGIATPPWTEGFGDSGCPWGNGIMTAILTLVIVCIICWLIKNWSSIKM